MNSKVNLFITLISVVLFGSCKPEQVPMNIVNLNKAQGLGNFSNVYALPKTVVRVKVTAERENYFKGPYCQYAKSYLGLSDVLDENTHKWRISEVSFETYPIIDTTNFYLIGTNNPDQMLQLSMNKDGFLESINDKDQNVIGKQQISELGKTSEVLAGNIELQEIKLVSFSEIPIPKEIISKNTTSEQAAALANKILVLRDDRAAILVGDGYTQALPVGETMKTMISEIDKTLENYMVMFKGKVVKESFKYQFDFVPEEPRKRTQAILFRFSEQNGIVDNSDVNGTPVIVEVESYENLKQLEQLNKRQFYLANVAGKNEIGKGFCYRVPETGIVRLMKNNRILQENKILIAQFGSVQALPSKYLDGKYIIRLYPELGALKSISVNMDYMEKEKTKRSKK
jgi:hypothetical protein